MARSFLVGLAFSVAVIPMTAWADEPPPGGASPAATDLKQEDAPLAPKKAKDDTYEKHPLEWNPAWPKIQKYEFGLTAAYGVTAIVGAVAIPGSPRWVVSNGFDTAVRNKLRIADPQNSQIARDVSDVGLTVLVNQAVIDDLFVAWWARKHPVIAWQLTMMDAETLAFTTSVNTMVAGLVGRQRPYVNAICQEKNLQDTSDCNGSNRYRSFFSGHTTAAFTLAGLTCIHHAELPLYGGGAADAFACIGAMAAASTTGMMRVVSDQHWMSDVLVGAVFGGTAGVGLPWLLHYRKNPRLASGSSEPKAGEAPPPMVVATPTGVQLVGAF